VSAETVLLQVGLLERVIEGHVDAASKEMRDALRVPW
jgi:hypothetical protein